MGTYTTLNIKVKLKSDTPKEVIDFLSKVIIDGDIGMGNRNGFLVGEVPRPELDHEFFDCARWYMLLTSTDGRTDLSGGNLICHNGLYTIVLETEFKNYDGEIHKFIDWISPYIRGSKTKTYLGWSLIETSNDRRYLHTTK